MTEALRPTPEVAKNGKLIAPIDAHPVIRKAAETNTGWDYSAECTKLYRRADIILDRFYNGVFTPEFKGKLPAPLIAIEPMNIRTLAAYRVVLDEYGLPFKLTFNEQHFQEEEGKAVWRWGEWSQMETLTHELGHHWQQLRGKDPYRQGKVTHNKEFTDKMEALGIHSAPGRGSHYAVAEANSPFGFLMKEWGIPKPDDVPRDETPPNINWWTILFGDERKGRSSLTKFQCPDCGLAVRVGIKGDPRLVHDPCTEKRGEKVFFINASLSQVIYDSATDFPFEPDEPESPEIWIDEGGNKHETIGVPAAWGFTAIMPLAKSSTGPARPPRTPEHSKKHIRKDGKKKGVKKK